MAVDFERDDNQKLAYSVGTDMDGLTALTLSCWVDIESNGATRDILSKWDFAAGQKSFVLAWLSSGGGRWFAEWDHGSGTDNVAITEANPQNIGWTHVASTWATTTRNLYVNGSAGTADTDTRTSLKTIPDDFKIGGQQAGGGNEMDGAMEHAAAWNVALTQSEISALAAGVNPLRIRPANLLIYVPLYSTDYINDISGKGYAGSFEHSGGGSLANIDGVGVQPLAFGDLFMPYESVAGGGALSVSVSESVTIGESAAVTLPDALAASVSESVTVGESITARLESYVSVSESVTIAEVVTVALPDALTADVSDAVTIGEETTVTLPDALAASVSESVTIAESVAVALPDALALAVSDGVTIGESVTVEATRTISVSESVTIGESSSVVLPDALEVSATEAVTIGESLNVSIAAAGAFSISVSDAVAIGEAVTLAMADLEANVSESVTIGESVAVTVSAEGVLSINVSESVTIAESVTLAMSTMEVSVTDAATIGESVTVSLIAIGTLTVSVSESVTIGEVVAVAPLALPGISASEAVTIGESVIVSPPEATALAVSVSDALTVGESVAITPLALPGINVSDSISIGEISTISIVIIGVIAGFGSVTSAGNIGAVRSPFSEGDIISPSNVGKIKVDRHG